MKFSIVFYVQHFIGKFRMSKDINGSEAKKVSVSLDFKDYQVLKDSAEEINVTVSKLLKKLVLRHIEKHRRENISLF